MDTMMHHPWKNPEPSMRSYSEQELVQYAPLVKQVARHLMLRLPPSIQMEDLIQAGMMGLLEALKNYDESKGASFETYAKIRVRGKILDEIRRQDWAPRSVHKNSRMISQKMRELEHQQGRSVSDREIADALEISLSDYHQMLFDSSTVQWFAIEDLSSQEDGTVLDRIPSSSETPFDGFSSQEVLSHVAKMISEMPEREQQVLSLYYYEEMNLKEIGMILGVTESRVCQIHAQAMLRLKSKIKGAV